MWSNVWQVRLGEGGRVMTDSQVGAAVTMRWIDTETPVRKPGARVWTKLGDAKASVMLVLSGEYEIVPEAKAKRLAPKILLALSLLLVASGGEHARRHAGAIAETVVAAPAPPIVTSSSVMFLVPQMRAPTAPPPIAKAEVATKAPVKVKVKPKAAKARAKKKRR